MPLSNYLANKVLTDNFDTGSVFVALYSSNPGNDGTGGTDVTNTIRAAGRPAGSFGAVAARAVSNDASVDFGTSAGAAAVSHFGLWSAATGGNFLGGGALQVTRNVQNGDPVAFLTGDLSVSLPG
jgi:hypothetical protein